MNVSVTNWLTHYAELQNC